MDFELPHATQKKIQERRQSASAARNRREEELLASVEPQEGPSRYPEEVVSQEAPLVEESNQYDAELEELMGETLLGRQGRWRDGLCSTKRWAGVLRAGLCPCKAVGRVSTLLEHEQASEKRRCCVRKLGPKGFRACLGAALLSLVTPIPFFCPALACWHVTLRRRLMRMYNFRQDDPVGGVGEVAAGLCCLACALDQELAFLEQQAAEGVLRFPWESGEAWDVRVVDRHLPTFKVIIMGERGVGKSSLFGRLLGKSFRADDPKEDTTVNMGFRLFHTFEKVPAGSIEFWDVPTDEFRAVESLVFRNVSVLLLVFTMLKKPTFDYVKEVYSSVYEKRDQYSDEAFKTAMGRRMHKPVPAVLVATKCDMFDEEVCTFYHDVLDFAEQHNLLLIKVSSRTGLGVAKVFKSVMNKLVVKKDNLRPLEETQAMQR